MLITTSKHSLGDISNFSESIGVYTNGGINNGSGKELGTYRIK